MKSLFYILFSFTCLSCSTVKYYESNDYQCYSALEVRGNKIIYRSDGRDLLEVPERASFVYLKAVNDSRRGGYLSLSRGIKKFIYLPITVQLGFTGEDQFEECNLEFASDEDNGKLAYSYYKNEDTITIHNSEPPIRMDYAFESVCFSGIMSRLPSTMVRVKKIDYSKFAKDIQKYDLKNPENEIKKLKNTKK